MSGIPITLDDEEIGAVGDGYQGVHPFGVAGVGEQRLAVGEAQRRRWRARIVHDLGGRDRMSQHFGLPAHVELHHLPRKPPLVRGGARKEYFERRIQPCARARRPRDQERPLALGKELGIEQKERKRAEMVAVQMRKHDPIDAIGIEAVRLERNQRRGPAIDQEGALRRLDEKTRVEPAAGAEGISRSYDRQAHAQADALGRAETAACQRSRLVSSSGTASFAGFMKSTATRPVISAIENASPATNVRCCNSASSRRMNSWMRGLLASAQAGTCGTSISFMAGCELRKTCDTGNSKCSSRRRFHISTCAIAKAPRPNRGGSG